MIHHLSIPARDPALVARVLAELMRGKSYPFPGGLDGAYMAVSGDARGTTVEVYPDGATLEPGIAEQQVGWGRAPTLTTMPFHFYLSVPRTREEIFAIGALEGWRTQRFGRAAPGGPPLPRHRVLGRESAFGRARTRG